MQEHRINVNTEKNNENTKLHAWFNRLCVELNKMWKTFRKNYQEDPNINMQYITP